MADVITLTQEGVEPEVIIAAIRTSGTDLPLTAADLTTMSEAGVDPEVIDVLNGGPCVCEPLPEPVPEPVAVTPKPGAPPPPPRAPEETPGKMNVAIKYSGGRSFDLVNLSRTKTYTGLTLTANGEYVYHLRKLVANSVDRVRLVSFVSKKSGKEMKKVDLKTLSISSNEGSFSKSF